jgi:hypothetical protein
MSKKKHKKQQTVEAKPRWRPRFDMRAVFIVIGLAAVLAWWVRNEMLAEQRREELIADFGKAGNVLDLRPNTAPTWRQRFVAWLRKKPVPPDVFGANMIFSIPDESQFVEFTKSFPTKLTWVDIKPSEATPKVLEALAKCDSIGHFNIKGPIDSSDESLARLAKIQNEYGFAFGAERVDDDLLKRLADANVRCNAVWDSDATFELSWLRVTDEGLRAAARLTKLQRFTANRNASDAGLAAFRNHPGLTAIELVGPGYTEASGDVLASIPNLNSLALVDTRLNDEAIAKAIAGHDLSTLKLRNTRIGEKTIEAIGNLKSLNTVELKNIELSSELATSLSKCPIGYLDISGDYDDQEIATLAPLAPTLTAFVLVSPSTTDAGLAWLGNASKVTTLMLRDTSITGATLRMFPNRVLVKSLGLGGLNVNKEVLAEIQNLPALADVALYGKTIDDEAIEVLPATINALQLMGTSVTLDGLKGLAEPGRQVMVFVWYPEGSPPPFSEQEIKDVETASQGGTKVKLQTVSETILREMLPKSSRSATSASLEESK